MWQYTPHTVPLAVATVIGLISTVVVWRRRDSAAETWALGVQVSVTAWTGLHLLTVSGTSLQHKLLWFGLFPATIASLVVSLLGFTLYYTGRKERLTRPRLAALLAFPLVVVVAGLTNDAHELLLVDPAVDRSGDFALLTYGTGPGLVVVSLVGYALAAVYSWLLFVKVRRSRNVYRNYSFLLFASVVLLTFVTVVSLVGLGPFPHFILLPFGYLFIGVVLIGATVSVKFVRMLPFDRILGALDPASERIVPLARDFVMETIDGGIIVLDADGRIVDVNDTGKHMIGDERAVGRPAREVVHPDLIRDGGRVVEVIVEEDSIEELQDEIWVEADDGARCYDVRVTAVDGPNGDVVGYVALLHDVTEQRKREQTLRERERELERRTTDLEAQKAKLERQNERLDRFASIVSHDLRNPLNVAHGYARLVAETARDGEFVEPEDVDRVLDAHDRMMAIIDDALELARRGKAITDSEPVDLGEVAREAWGTVETDHATLEVAGTDEIHADRDRIRTVFENLYRNSVEHGGADVTVRVGVLGDGSGFYVEDDGPGIPEADRDDVLERGYTTSSDGTGLGLVIVGDVAGAHGWSLRVTGGVDGGARFEFGDVDVVE